MSTKTVIDEPEQMERLLREETLGFLGVSGEDSVYVVPLTYCYQDGTIYFHGALTGKKLDRIRRDPQVCFTVARQAGPPARHPEGGLCQVESDSVVCYGTARILEDLDERRDALNVFNRRMDPSARPITVEAAARCATVEITVREMSGRAQRGLEHTYWRHTFDDAPGNPR